MQKKTVSQDRPKKYWLKMVGSSRLPVTSWNKPHVEFPLRKRKRKDGRVAEEGAPRINAGDMMVLFATGHKTIFGIAKVTRGAYDHTREFKSEKRWGKWSVDLKYLSKPLNPVTSGPIGTGVNKAFIGNQRGYKSVECKQFNDAAKALGITPEDCA